MHVDDNPDNAITNIQVVLNYPSPCNWLVIEDILKLYDQLK